MKCFVELDCCADIIEIPEPIAPTIGKYRNRFLDWIYDKKNKHPYWIKGKDGMGNSFVGVRYDTSTFVEWLNKHVIKNKYEPAVIVEHNVEACPEGMLRIFF